MFHVFHNVPRKMGLVEHAKGAWLVDNWEMFHVFQYFLVNKISITTNNGRRSVLRKFCFCWNIGTFVPISGAMSHSCGINRVPHKCSTRCLDRGTCGTYFSQRAHARNPHHSVMIVVHMIVGTHMSPLGEGGGRSPRGELVLVCPMSRNKTVILF